MKIANQQELEAFIKGAADQFAARGVPQEQAVQILDAQLAKHAEALGLVTQQPAARREVIDGFKKAACEQVKQIRK